MPLARNIGQLNRFRALPPLGVERASDVGWMMAKRASMAERFSIAPNWVLLRAFTWMAAREIRLLVVEGVGDGRLRCNRAFCITP